MTIEQERLTPTRSPAQFFFEVGFGACWAEAFVKNDGTPPFPLTDAGVERAWAIAGEAHDDPAEFDRYLALASSTEGERTEALCDAYNAGACDAAPGYAAMTEPTTSGDVGKLCERLRASAQSSSHVQQMMAEGKSLRNSDGEHKDLYMWPEPEQTLEGQAAAILTQMEAREQALREALERVKRLERSIMIDVRTAHSGRGNGASSEMRSDDRDMVSELRDTFAEIDSLLAGAGS